MKKPSECLFCQQHDLVKAKFLEDERQANPPDQGVWVCLCVDVSEWVGKLGGWVGGGGKEEERG